MKRSATKFTLIFLFLLALSGVDSNTILYVQSPKAKLLTNPKMDSLGDPLPVGSNVKSIKESGLFVQVQSGDKTGYVSKLFVSAFPPSQQIKLGVSSGNLNQAQARQRASDFTKTAAARGLTDTQKIRVRGKSEEYDFESLLWLERVGTLSASDLASESNFITNSTDTSPNPKPEKSLWETLLDSDGPSPQTKVEVKVGRSLSAKLIHRYGLVKNEKFTKYLNRLGQSISSVTSRTDLSFRFGVLDTKEINAFAAPGGFVFLTRGAIEQIQSESELAGVLSHEISHIVLNHHGEFEVMNVFLDIVSSFLGPTGGEIVTGPTEVLIAEMEAEFFTLGRDQNTEWEADESSVFLLSQIGYPMKDFSTYLLRISKSLDSELLSKTHPNAQERVKRMEKTIAEFSSKPNPADIKSDKKNSSSPVKSSFLELKASL